MARPKYYDETTKDWETFTGKDGGYYTVTVTQPDANTAAFDFTPSKPEMAAVQQQTVTLPAGPSGDNYVLTDADKTEIAELAAELVEVPSNVTSGGWEIIYELEVAEELAQIDDRTIDRSKNEYLLAIWVPAVETKISGGNSNLFGHRDITFGGANNEFASTTGAKLHAVYMKKITESEALVISVSTDKSLGFNDEWVRTRVSKITYGGYGTTYGLLIQNMVPAGTHIKIYGK